MQRDKIKIVCQVVKMTGEHEQLLPIANVGRIMKQILPPNAKISKEAKETMQECASEFIGFVTSEACERCRKEKRKTVSGDDICWALSSLGFDRCSEGMLRYLARFREYETRRADNMQSRGDHEETSRRNLADPFFDFGILQTSASAKPSSSTRF